MNLYVYILETLTMESRHLAQYCPITPSIKGLHQSFIYSTTLMLASVPPDHNPVYEDFGLLISLMCLK